jgi:hypothetical protein
VTDFTRTRQALAAYDASEPERRAAWDTIANMADLKACQSADRAAADAVREAFAVDAAGINSRENAFLIHPGDPAFRKMVGA